MGRSRRTNARDNSAGLLNDRYEVGRAIGSGGTAIVFFARDMRLDRDVAIKQLKREHDSEANIERFTREIQVIAHLRHPHLMPLFDRGDADGVPFYVMPYVAGESLRDRLRRETRLPIDEAIRIAVAIADALDYAHRHGVIHRDLKPENILLDDGEPILADFGIAVASQWSTGVSLTQAGTSVGTPQYMSPEQASGETAIDCRTDVYSLGALTYEMLTGAPPHSAATAQATMARVIAAEPRPLSSLRREVPTYVARAVGRALEKAPADRYTTAREFGHALRGSAMGAQPDATRFSSWRQRYANLAARLADTACALAATSLMK